MSKKSYLREFLINCPVSISLISNKSKVSRSSIHRFINGDNIKDETADKIIFSIENDLKIKYDYNLSENTEFLNKGLDTNYLISLQKSQIKLLEDKIKHLESDLNNVFTEKFSSNNPIWKEINYDVNTYQKYLDDGSFRYFESYKIIEWQDFFAKLGYHGKEGEEVYENHLSFVNKEKYKNKNYKNVLIVDQKETSDAFLNLKSTREFFKSATARSVISALETHRVTYLHKDGSQVPAIVSILFNIEDLSSTSKIKFLNSNNS